MQPRILLDDNPSVSTIEHPSGPGAPSPCTRFLLDADWEGSSADTLMLYVAEEPRVGLRFSYHGLDWEIVDYREGWIASLVVD